MDPKVYCVILCGVLSGCLTGYGVASMVRHRHHRDDTVSHRSPLFDEHVEAVQRALSDQHYYWGKIDGIDGPETIQAVRDFQKNLGVPVTGVADGRTAEALGVR